MSVLLVGTGQVGVRAARQIVDTPGSGPLLVASSDPARAAALAASLHAEAEGLPGAGVSVPSGTAAVVVATGGAAARAWARAAVAAGVPVATLQDGVAAELDEPARDAGVPVVAGAAVTPGLSDVLARHAADLFDRVDEVHVARAGASGPACVDEVRAERRGVPGEWRSGAWTASRAFGPQLVWFPEPVGVRECQLVSAGVAATVETVPTAALVTVRWCGAPSTGWLSTQVRRNPVDSGWGATRVEVTGLRAGTTASVVYAAVDRTAVLAGAVVATTGLALAGLLPGLLTAPPGVRALGAVATPVAFLTELAGRGVRAAAFEGVLPSA